MPGLVVGVDVVLRSPGINSGGSGSWETRDERGRLVGPGEVRRYWV